LNCAVTFLLLGFCAASEAGGPFFSPSLKGLIPALPDECGGPRGTPMVSPKFLVGGLSCDGSRSPLRYLFSRLRWTAGDPAPSWPTATPFPLFFATRTAFPPLRFFSPYDPDFFSSGSAVGFSPSHNSARIAKPPDVTNRSWLLLRDTVFVPL